MIPLIPSLALALFSFICSAFVILRIVIPILPPHPLSRRVAPSEFGLPNFRSLSPADKSHIWLASLDLLALAMVVWQVIMETLGGPSGLTIINDPTASVRVWLALTVRQTCLLMVAAITLLHVRMGRSVSFGTKHWMLWAPTALLIITSTSIAGVLSGAGVATLFTGLLAYSSTIAVLSSVAFGCLVGTLLIIKGNLASIPEEHDSWQVEEKPRPSFATEDIDAIRDGASWITSTAGGHGSSHGSISGWSFSTHHTVTTSNYGHGGRPQGSHNPSVPVKSTFWFGSSTPHVNNVPPVPPLPSPYGQFSPTAAQMSDPDPFRRESPSPGPSPLLAEYPRQRLGSQTSWLTSTNGSHTTPSAWSFPATQRDDMSEESSMHNGSTTNVHTTLLPSGTAVSSPVTPAMSSAQVLGGYGYAPQDAEKNLASLAATSGTQLDISVYRGVAWLAMIWVPMGLSYPYLINAVEGSSPSAISSILLVLSLTMSSPILALNILLRSPIPIPSGLFDIRGELPTSLLRGPSPIGSTPTPMFSSEYKRSTSTNATVVEGRRSGDVWITNGDAVEGKSKVGRALGMMSPRPKLSVLPTEDDDDEPQLSPPISLRMDDSSLSPSIHNTPQSETSEQFGRIRKDSKASSHFSGGDASMAYASQIMIAQRHYSTLARTMLVSASPEKQGLDVDGEAPLEDVDLNVDEALTSAVRRVSKSHLRTRSVSSVMEPSTPTEPRGYAPSPPPAFPLPPTPPNVRAARLAKHKKSYSSGFSFGAVDDLNEIDALTAGVLPILVPDWTARGKGAKKTGRKLTMGEFGHGSPEDMDFPSPDFHSTPARTKAAMSKARKESHKRAHFSLPSLGLGKDGIHSLAVEIGRALETYTSPASNIDVGRRNTVFGADSVPSYLPTATGGLQVVPEERHGANLGRTFSTRSLGLRAEVPHNVDTARNSMVTIDRPLPSAASTVTLFEFDKDIDGISFMKAIEDGDGPLAESTPHNNRAGRYETAGRDEVPPLPTRTPAPRTNKQKRRSSIVYIKSDENAAPPAQQRAEPSNAVTRMHSFVRAVRPLMPKKKSPKSATPSPAQQGLRPLSLLQNRDLNASPPPDGARKKVQPLNLSVGRSKGRTLTPDVNNLARSDTSRARSIMMEQENLPDVFVRPPSHTEHQPFAYSFRS
ncbi:hypothetical protein BDZ89DRAFT_1219832 [Hymenopellis radicata]|nr:hypothetical protein BDZ89DRAFT_1219832 [Hymenopellis radicata]